MGLRKILRYLLGFPEPYDKDAAQAAIDQYLEDLKRRHQAEREQEARKAITQISSYADSSLASLSFLDEGESVGLGSIRMTLVIYELITTTAIETVLAGLDATVSREIISEASRKSLSFWQKRLEIRTLTPQQRNLGERRIKKLMRDISDLGGA